MTPGIRRAVMQSEEEGSLVAFVHKRLQTASQVEAMERSELLLQRVRAIFPGRFDNRRQRALELFQSHAAPHAAMTLQVDQVDWPHDSGCAFAVRASSSGEAALILSRLYVFRPSWPGPGKVRLAVHTIEPAGGGAVFPEGAMLADLSGPAGDLRGRAMSVTLRGGAVVCLSRPGAKSAAERLSLGDGGIHFVSHAPCATDRGPLDRPDRLPYRLDRSFAAV